MVSASPPRPTKDVDLTYYEVKPCDGCHVLPSECPFSDCLTTMPGGARGRRSDERARKARELLAQGLNHRQIAERLGVSERSAGRLLARGR